MKEKIVGICSNPPQKRKIVDKAEGIEIAIPVPDWEAVANQILKALREEIENVGNPYDETDEANGLWFHVGFEACRQKILSLLK